MMTEGAFTVILNRAGDKVLLVKRRDVPLWDLPGGRREPGESPAECAVREAFEETGVVVDIIRATGEYKRPSVDDIQHVFMAQLEVHTLPPGRGDETSALKWFPLHRLPWLMVPHRKRQIRDSASDSVPVTTVLREPLLTRLLTPFSR